MNLFKNKLVSITTILNQRPLSFFFSYSEIRKNIF